MKKYAYILLILASVSTMATAQIKIGNYSFKDGSEYISREFCNGYMKII